MWYGLGGGFVCMGGVWQGGRLRRGCLPSQRSTWTLLPMLVWAHLILVLQNALVMSGYGVFLAEVGREEEAVPLLQKAAQLDPDNGFEKYL